jgi:hypothetical protein
MGFRALLGMVDRAALRSLGDDGIQYQPGTGPAIDVDGIFDAEYFLVDAGEAGVSSSGPAVVLRVEDLPSGWEADADKLIIFNGVQYRPHTIQPDGMGGVRFLMHLV